MRGEISQLKKYSLKDEEIINYYDYNSKYFENYCETIIHFHHFFELIFKQILIDKFELKDEEKVGKMEFSKMLEVLCKQIKTNISRFNNLNFIVEGREWLEDLNCLRNRMLHRGLYILGYIQLDEFVGRYILPFIEQLRLNVTDVIAARYWTYRKLNCGIDPINEIIKVYRDEKYDICKIAWLKELGRAAYNNNLNNNISEKLFIKGYIQEIETSVQVYQFNVSDIMKCPVCGLNTLIIFEESDGDYDEEMHDGCFKEAWTYTYEVECKHCNFHIYNNIDNPSEYNFNEIEDYFWTREW